MSELTTHSTVSSKDTSPFISIKRLRFIWCGMAILMLMATLYWHLPMMMWDHLDLIPFLQHWQSNTLTMTQWFTPHGGHLHTAAYAVLLVSTLLSNGQTWLDCVLSWALLCVFAETIFQLWKRQPWKGPLHSLGVLLLMLLCWYPGHLVNLQWGWQVAVFLCLVGSVVCIDQLSRTELSVARQSIALATAIVALLSFAIGMALLPVAFCLIAMRSELSWLQRGMVSLPWIALTALAVMFFSRASEHDANTTLDGARIGWYALNFIGAAIARFATDSAPILASAGLASGLVLALRTRQLYHARPWFGLFLFAICASITVAVGRADAYGVEQAFVSRYVSFSIVFWIGWIGLLQAQFYDRPMARPRTIRYALTVVALFALCNAIQLSKRAATTASHAEAIAKVIRTQGAHAPKKVLAELYFDQPEIAAERIEQLHRWGYAPF